MLRKHKELEIISDYDFNKIVSQFDEKISKHIRDTIVNEFVSYYISTGYNMDALWDENFKLTCQAAVDTLCQVDNDSYDINKVRKILKNKYNLKVINDKPIIIEELK